MPRSSFLILCSLFVMFLSAGLAVEEDTSGKTNNSSIDNSQTEDTSKKSDKTSNAKDSELLDITAESVEFERTKNMMIATGQAIAKRGNETLRADFMTINTETYDVYAEGNVSYESGSEMWVGDKLRYNFKTGSGDFGSFKAFFEPFYLTADTSHQLPKGHLELNNATVTTCEGEKPVVYLKSKRVLVVPGVRVYAKHVTLLVKGVPIFYSPIWEQNIGSRNFISFTPGFSSKMHAFLLTDFNYRLSRHFEASTHFDVRTRRGFGLGQDIMWSETGNVTELSTERFMGVSDRNFWDLHEDPDAKREYKEAKDEAWFGDLILYGLLDNWPDEGKEQDYEIDKERYRIRFYHNHSFDERNYGMVQLNYLSDPKIIEHFFRKEYKASPEPENYLSLVHSAEKFTLSLMFQQRLNDFYTSIDKLPELTLDVMRQQILDSNFYYEGEHSAGFLKKEWEKNEKDEEDYSLFRFHSENMLYYSTKQLGFLNLIPRAGYHGTYYSKTKDKEETSTIVQLFSNDDPDAQPVLTTNIVSRVIEQGSVFRSVPELGIEASFKAFKVWDTHPGSFINDLRHIVRPYVDYTYMPEPNALKDELFQFDEIDELDKLNEIKIGVENKLQTRRDKRYDLINLDTWTTYRFDPADDQEDFGHIGFDLKSRPLDDVYIRISGFFNQYETRIESLSSRLDIYHTRTYYNLEHIYRHDNKNLLVASAGFTPHVNWKFGGEIRYDLEDSELEQYAITVQRVLDCVTVKAGFEWLDDDYGFWFQFWFTEFPKGRLDISL